ncbi:apical endosomal glycoprotein-like [Ornithorhynchus anatinus]|uniref:apical endosomal glycoprotein-like n=1 Tax=Ornithorhynchus anatinus TaxID=9258 RepID=UPI0019D4E995|nr:apical endosomal glycoprotein-like [Ornithorhynchus anatinus]
MGGRPAPHSDLTWSIHLGWYMVIGAHREKDATTVVQQTSTVHEAAPACEMHLWYRGWGEGEETPDPGELLVEVTHGQETLMLWQSTSPVGDFWKELVVPMGRVPGSFWAQCPQGHFCCARRACVEPDLVCDGEDDCGDRLDGDKEEEASHSATGMVTDLEDFESGLEPWEIAQGWVLSNGSTASGLSAQHRRDHGKNSVTADLLLISARFRGGQPPPLPAALDPDPHVRPQGPGLLPVLEPGRRPGGGLGQRCGSDLIQSALPAEDPCSPGQFACDDRCLRNEQRCDFIAQCTDSTDEEGCGHFLSLQKALGKLLGLAWAHTLPLGPSGPDCTLRLAYFLQSGPGAGQSCRVTSRRAPCGWYPQRRSDVVYNHTMGKGYFMYLDPTAPSARGPRVHLLTAFQGP